MKYLVICFKKWFSTSCITFNRKATCFFLYLTECLVNEIIVACYLPELTFSELSIH